MTRDEKKIKEVLTRGVENIYPSQQALEKKLKSGDRIRLYCGYDPTAPTLHVGHAITIRKLAQFQVLDHEVIFLIGDFTGMIGDPTDKAAIRKKMTRQELLKNAKNYKKQASKILRFTGKNPAKILYNSEWNDKLSFIDLINLASNFTAQQTLARDMFKKRIEDGKDLYLHEFLYPLVQAYDSVAMDVDLEIGGNDQMFNMLAGRTLMKKMKNKEKLVLTTKLLIDVSGQKMGKTEGKMISLDTPANEMFGQIMSWSDEVITSALELCTDVPMEEIRQIEKQIKEGRVNPRDAKARLAREIVAIHHNKKAALRAEKEFNRVFQEKEQPKDTVCYKVNKGQELRDVLLMNKAIASRSRYRQLIKQGAVDFNQETVKNVYFKIQKPGIVRVGKKDFYKIVF